MVRAMAFVVAAVYLVWSVSASAQTALRSGDMAAVGAGGAPLMVNGQAAAQLPEKTWFEVVRTSGSWTAGYAYLNGQRKSGWVLTAKLAPEPPQRQAEAAAAWEEAGAHLEKDARGAVLSIDASDSQVTDDHLAQAGAFPRLEELTLAGSQATAAGLTHLASLPRLKRLFLDGLPLADDDLKPLAQLTALEGLSLANTPVSDAGLANLSRLTNLQVLNLSKCQVTDEGLRHLEPLVNMETLALKNTQIRGAGLVHLRRMTPLNVLNLSNTPLEGPRLMHLGGLDNLRILHVAGCNLNQEDIENLEEVSTSLAVFD